MKKKFQLTRVVTRDLVTDSFQGIKNMFGLRLRGYEKIISRTVNELYKEMDLRYRVEWFRLIINPLTTGSAMIIIYGEGKSNE